MSIKMSASLAGRDRQRGFTLLEALVALVVMSLGLLGLAGLQALALRDSQTAYLRSIATQQAYDIADRMRANMVGVAAGDYDNIAAGPGTDPGCIAVGCTPAQIAQTDRFQWNTANAALLPSGSGTVAVVGATDAFDITVSWTEKTGKEEGGTGAAANLTRSFVTRVQP